jgi:glyoxylate reductase
MGDNISDKKVFVSRRFPELGVELLSGAGLTVTAWDQDLPMTQDELIESARHHNALFIAATEKIDKRFFQACPHLDIISQFAVGYDNIDVAEATRLGIPIGYAPGAMSDATADVAFGLMITASRKMFHMHKSILKGEWTYFRPKANLGVELKRKTLGIFGLGRIGMELAKRCRGAYEMDIIYHNRGKNPSAEQQLGARWVDFETLLAESDVLSVHCALTNETTGLFNKAVFRQMKPGAIFINTSRGAVHNEKDLIDALQEGLIWGAGLDVTNPEPMNPDNPLLQMPNVSILPHIGSATVEARNKMARLAVVNIIEFYKSGRVPNIVNPEVLENRKR